MLSLTFIVLIFLAEMSAGMISSFGEFCVCCVNSQIEKFNSHKIVVGEVGSMDDGTLQSARTLGKVMCMISFFIFFLALTVDST